MNDCISRKAAIDALDGEITVTGRTNAEAVRGYANLVCDRIKRLPSAEPKKGKWVDVVELDSGDYPFKVGVCCSACGFETVSEDNYCPHCGAKMEVTE